jgi:hypothetical protein
METPTSKEISKHEFLNLLTENGAKIEREIKSAEDCYRITFTSEKSVTTIRIKFEDLSGADLSITNMTTYPKLERGGGVGSTVIGILLSLAHQSGLKDIRAVQVGEESESFWIKNGFSKQDGENNTNDFVYNTTMENLDLESFMQMPPREFDQSQEGWRSLANIGKKLEAAELIQEYIKLNEKRIKTPEGDEFEDALELMHFHVGQQLAMSGIKYYADAINSFKKSYYYKVGQRELWNQYVSATIGFLENDISKIENAINTIINSNNEDKRSGNLDFVLNFKKAIEVGERDYEKVYSWPRE